MYIWGFLKFLVVIFFIVESYPPPSWALLIQWPANRVFNGRPRLNSKEKELRFTICDHILRSRWYLTTSNFCVHTLPYNVFYVARWVWSRFFNVQKTSGIPLSRSNDTPRPVRQCAWPISVHRMINLWTESSNTERALGARRTGQVESAEDTINEVIILYSAV